jgi:WD40 repeat protein
MIKDHGRIFKHDGVQTITTTPDTKWLFAASPEGHLKQIRLDGHEEVKDYGDIYNGHHITCLEKTRDSKWLFTGSYDGHVKRINVKYRKEDKDIGRVCDDRICRMKITPDEEKLLVGDDCGHLQLISLIDGELIKDFYEVHDHIISAIVITAD